MERRCDSRRQEVDTEGRITVDWRDEIEENLEEDLEERGLWREEEVSHSAREEKELSVRRIKRSYREKKRDESEKKKTLKRIAQLVEEITFPPRTESEQVSKMCVSMSFCVEKRRRRKREKRRREHESICSLLFSI